MVQQQPDPVTDAAPAAASIETFVLGPFETNCYVVRRADEGACWIVDAGFAPERLIERIRAMDLTPEALVLTHAHADHIAGAYALRRAWPDLPILMHEAEVDWVARPALNLSAITGIDITAPPPTRLVAPGEKLELAGEAWEVLHTPGHSPGSISLYSRALGAAIVGDTLFAESIGRTDFPGCSHDDLIESIREKLYALPDDTTVHPGHGPSTTIGREKATNPFVRG